MLRRGLALAFLLPLLTACGSTPQYTYLGVPQSLLATCLTLPKASTPGTNLELAEGFVVARKGHETCAGVVQAIELNFGADPRKE